MIKRLICTTVSAVLVSLAGCQSDRLTDTAGPAVPDGYVAVNFGVEIPDMIKVNTRAVDPNAKGVETVRLFCFDKKRLFVSTATTTAHSPEENDEGYYLNGKFSANVVDYTHIIHIVANQNLDDFHESDFLGLPEDEVMTTLVGSSEKMIYWGRVEAAEEGKIAEAMEAGEIPLVRNQAKVEIPENDYFEVTGFYVCNTSAFGTLAPYNRETRKFDWMTATEKYITLPDDPGRVSLPQDVETRDAQYIFETDSRGEEPVSVIIKGHNIEPEGEEDLYYRVLLLDPETQEALPVIRNHSYRLNFVGGLDTKYGATSMQEALEGTATNNVWFSISDDIKTVKDGKNVLSVDETYVVLLGNNQESLEHKVNYSYTEDDKGVPEELLQVSWVPGSNNVGHPVPVNAYDEDTGEGEVTLTLDPMGEYNKREGVLLIKKGKLQRKVKIITVKQMNFSPAWISTDIYEGQADQKVTLMFTIPETCPEELFPLRVLISINHIDVRSASGMKLSTITRENNPEEYGKENGIGYKYVYEADKPGVQRLYFRTTLRNEETGKAFVEQQYFERLEKQYTFSDENKKIDITDLDYFNASDIKEDGGVGPGEGGDYAKDEDIYYTLVPQKVNAYVVFEVGTFENNSAIAGGEDDEFLLYSQNLSAYEDDKIPGGASLKNCSFREYGSMGTGGRVFGFYPEIPGREKYKIYLHTNRAQSAEVVRIASNQPGSPWVREGKSGTYTGNVYRSITFELANYNPFKFASEVDGTAGSATDVSKLEWTYEYGRKVDIEFDITSFIGTDDKEVDPFGTPFEVYIDAPMLAIDEHTNTLSPDKFYQGEDGRFVYVVNKDRNGERDVFNGERKVLHFKTNKIVNAGNISISSNKEVVVFDTENYVVENKPIVGKISLSDATTLSKNAFVSFERSRDRTRIGSVYVKGDGTYELRLRGEYSFGWDGDEKVAFYYRDGSTEYSVEVANLAELFGNPDVELKKKL